MFGGKIPLHWVVSASLVIPGALLYRAVDSRWFDPGNYAFLLSFVGMTLAIAGLVIFIFMLNFYHKKDASK